MTPKATRPAAGVDPLGETVSRGSHLDEVRVVALGAAERSPSFAVRVLLLRQELEAHGVFLQPHPLFDQGSLAEFYRAPLNRRLALLVRARRRVARRLRALPFGTSVALVQRQADFLPVLTLERLAASGRRLVWDVDDAIWYDHTRYAGGHRLAFIKGTKRKVRWLAAHADHVIAANRVLASQFEDRTDRVTVIPSLVETRGVALRQHADRRELVLGWIGSHTTLRYVERVRPILQRLTRELQDRSIRLLVVGGVLQEIPGVAVESQPWSVEGERSALSRMDVGLLPMPDNVWTRGKSSYKALKYMAAGVPVVGDDVGVVREAIGPGGVVVNHNDHWIAALTMLGRDATERARLGRLGRDHVDRHFSVRRWAPEIASILRGER